MKKGYKKCQFCANEIKEEAVKCQFCGEFLDGKKPKNETLKKEKSSIYGIIVPIILIILILIGLYYAIVHFNKSETWQGFYYEDVLEDGKEIGGPIFDNYEACKNRAVNKFSKGQEAFCSSNCHDSVDGTPICEKVIRTRHPLPGFGEVFEGIDEIIGKKEDECKSKYDNYNNIIQSAYDDYDAYHHCDVDVYYSKSYKSCIGEAACNAGGGREYNVSDIDKKEILFNCSVPGDDDCEETIEEIRSVLK